MCRFLLSVAPQRYRIRYHGYLAPMRWFLEGVAIYYNVMGVLKMKSRFGITAITETIGNRVTVLNCVYGVLNHTRFLWLFRQ